MATTFYTNLTSLTHHSLNPNKPSITTTTTTTTKTTIHIPIRCGPRGNRGPLVKGRVLSIEAIQAVQSLKRAHKQDPTNTHFPSLSRLIKSDLFAALRELLRQDLCTLALHVFSTVRSEYPPVDLSLYADMVQSLARNRMVDDIDRLICDLERDDEGIIWGEDKGLVRLIKAVIGAERRESTVRICGLMRKSGCGSTWKVDDYVLKVLSKGLRRFGEVGLADEVEKEFGWVSKGNLEKVRV